MIKHVPTISLCLRVDTWAKLDRRRRHYRELKRSIKEHGFLSPLIVEPGPDETYLVVCGLYRLAVAKDLGITQLPVSIVPPDEGNTYHLVASKPRQPIDEAQFCKVARHYLKDHTIEDLAKLVNMSKPHIRRILQRNPDAPPESAST